MKSKYLLSAVTVLAMSMSAFAQYDDAGYDNGYGDQQGYADQSGYGDQAGYDDQSGYAEQSSDAAAYAPAPEEQQPAYAEPAAQPAPQQVRQDDDDDNSSSALNGRAFRLGGRLQLGFSDFWGVDEVFDNMYTKDGVKMENRFDAFTGVNVGLGLIGNFRINKMFSIMPEFVFSISRYAETLDSFYDWYYGMVDYEYSWWFIDLDIDPVVRFMPLDFIYIEAGARLSVVLAALESYSYNSTYDGTEIASDDVDLPEAAAFLPGVLFGVGASVPIKRGLTDIGLRFVWDLASVSETPFEYCSSEDNFVSQRIAKTVAKRFEIQFVINYWI